MDSITTSYRDADLSLQRQPLRHRREEIKDSPEEKVESLYPELKKLHDNSLVEDTHIDGLSGVDTERDAGSSNTHPENSILENLSKVKHKLQSCESAKKTRYSKAFQSCDKADRTRPRPKEIPEEDSRHFFLSPTGILLGVATVLLLGASACWRWWPSASAPSKADAIVDTLRSEFASQPNLTFRVVGSALNSTLAPVAKAPAVILLFAAAGAEPECEKFARRLSASVRPDFLHLSGEKYRGAKPDESRLQIDTALKSALAGGGPGAVLIERLDLLDARTASILHTYADHENAPFNRAALVMTVWPGKSLTGGAQKAKQWDEIVHKHLLDAWKKEGVDQVTSLLSRLTVSVAAVTKERQ